MQPFINAIPPIRLGVSHASLQSFCAAVYIDKPEIPSPPAPRKKRKEYSLVMITESPKRRILLGLKNRGFGTGFYNSFGGKIDPTDESVASGAARELKEEANISVPVNVMEKCFVGKLDFTFDDEDEVEMLVHLFRVEVKCIDKVKETNDVTDDQTVLINSSDIRPPTDGEITPQWFDDWCKMPLNIMHADDSLWVPKVLGSPSAITLNGWFHFAPGGPTVNSIQHHYLEFN